MKFFLEDGYVSLNKIGEELCGDKVESIRSGNKTTAVLADGLGSGVKANILATLTAKTLSIMASNDLPIDDCIETIANILPVCNLRGIAYSTFTLVNVDDEGRVNIYEFDNPQVIYLRKGRCLELERTKKEISGKNIYHSYIEAIEDDVIICLSDGAPYAGLGKTLNFGWDRANIKEYIERNYESNWSARALAAYIAKACKDLYMDEPGDDTTVFALKLREHLPVNIMIGPPADKNNDEKVVKEFMGLEGVKIICGGTTSQIVARYLGKDIQVDLEYVDKSVPPTATLEGVDLVTEGVITIKKAVELSNLYLSNESCEDKFYTNHLDGASKIADFLFEKATNITIFIGTSVNYHHNLLPIDSVLKLKIVETLKSNLELMGKHVMIKYY